VSLLGATILTAVATVVLAAGAIVTAVFAYLALRKQSREVSLLLEQNERDTDERRKAQAARVFLATPRDNEYSPSPYVRNASELPIYDAEVRLSGLEAGHTQSLGTIMPGIEVPVSHVLNPDQAVRPAILTFRDAAGITWGRMPDGRLFETLPPEEPPASRIPSEFEDLRPRRTAFIGRVARSLLRRPRSNALG
jgi:hypothetical protein